MIDWRCPKCKRADVKLLCPEEDDNDDVRCPNCGYLGVLNAR